MSGKVALVPATSADFAAFTPLAKPPVRVWALAGRIGGRTIGLGGICFWPNGVRSAFVDLTEEARRYPVALHKAALITLAKAHELGIRRLAATAKTGHPAAERWLIRLGFTPRKIAGITVFINDRP